MKISNFKKYYPSLGIAALLLTVAAFTSANSSFLSTIASAGYGGNDTNCPDLSSMMIMASNSTVAAGTNVDFNGRNFGHEQDVLVTLNGAQVARPHADGGGNFSTGSIAVPSTAGTYTYTFMAVNCNTPITYTITVTGNSTDGNNTNTSGASITPVNQTVSGGQHVNFNGRNFGHEENVAVSLNGSIIATVHADGGGNFSTGSMMTPATSGTYTYTFTGQTSGTSLTSTVTVQ